jgi:alpha-tubulin suppressor-like RCC1 family protein
MQDNGIEGDEVAGDGIFTLRLMVAEPAAGELRLQVSAAFRVLLPGGGGRRRSFQRLLWRLHSKASSTPVGAPVANAGDDFSSVTATAVVLNGSDSYDPDGDRIAFEWTLVSTPPGSATSLDRSSVPNPSFTADEPGSYVFELVVDDGVRQSVPDRVTVMAHSAGNAPPNSRAGPDQHALVGLVVTLDGSASVDPEGAAISLAWSFVAIPPGSSLTDGDIVSPNTHSPQIVPDVPGTYLLQLEVNDGVLTDGDTVRVLTSYPNVAPNADAGPDQVVTINTTTTLDGAASFDPDSGPAPLSFSWRFVAMPPGSSLTNVDIQGETTATPTFTPDLGGAYLLRLETSDGERSDLDNALIDALGNHDPEAVDDTATTMPNTSVTISVLANDSDPDGDPLTLTSVSAASNGTAVSNSHDSVTYTPNFGFFGADSFTYTLSDGRGGTSTADVTIAVGVDVLTAPILQPAGGTFASPLNVKIVNQTLGAVVRYTTNGLEPTLADPALPSNGTVTIHQSTTLKAQAFLNGQNSETTSETYIIDFGSVAEPSFVPPGDTYATPQMVTLVSATANATIRYTLDGSEPTPASKVYTTPIAVSGVLTIKARGYKPDWLPSASAVATYNTGPPSVERPIFVPGPGTYATFRRVTVTCGTAGAIIHYTTNGVDPTEDDPVVASGETVLVDRALPLKARAFAGNLEPSAVQRGDYLIVGAVAGGQGHSLALKSDGTVWAWGLNSKGQIGDGTFGNPQKVPKQVAGLSDVTAVAAGPLYSLVLRGDGTVWGWGYNKAGQLGNGGFEEREKSPVQAIGLSGVVAIAAGGGHTLALKEDGTVWAAGNNGVGQLGNNSTGQSARFIQTWDLGGIVAIAAGASHSLALKSDGTVWAWGSNKEGQLGDGTSNNFRTRPVSTIGLRGVVSLAAHEAGSLALRTDGAPTGSVWAWGSNDSGQFGDGSTKDRESPVHVLTGAIAIGLTTRDGALLRREKGRSNRVWAAGMNTEGQLGDGTNIRDHADPYRKRLMMLPVERLNDVIAFATGDEHLLAITGDARVWGWGSNASFQIHSEDTAPTRYPVPVHGLRLADTSWLTGDADQDGLSAGLELDLGLDPLNADMNADGILDGAEVAAGLSPTDQDMDGDGVPNVTEVAAGTDVLRSDSDGDGRIDGTDCFPLDPLRWECPPADPTDRTPPTITLTEPTNAVLVRSDP